MKRLTKRKKSWRTEVEHLKKYDLQTGINLSQKFAQAKFSEGIDIVLTLGVDSRKSDQAVRGSCSLPHGTGKQERILVFAKGEKEQEARDAGADYVGGADLAEKIKGGWFDFDRVVTTPDMMAEVGKIGKILGPRGLMPNPKVGTVTFNVKEIVTEIKKGQVEFRTDKKSNLHVPIGKAKFPAEQLKDNINSLLEVVMRLKPASAKGTYIKKMCISSTMGPGILIDVNALLLK